MKIYIGTEKDSKDLFIGKTYEGVQSAFRMKDGFHRKHNISSTELEHDTATKVLSVLDGKDYIIWVGK